MSKIALLAKMTAKEGKRDEMVAKLKEMVTYVESEGGTEVYAMHLDQNDANVIWFYEMYSDMDSLVAHGGSDMMKGVGTELRDLAAARPEMTMLTPVAAKGLSL